MKKKRKPSNFLLHRDAFISACFTFFLYFLIHLVAVNTHYLDPVTSALEDFEFSDLYFSRINAEKPELSEEIVLFNIGGSSRSEIAAHIEALKTYNPRVIGVDVTFKDPKDSSTDARLHQAIRGETPIVLASRLEYPGKYTTTPAVTRNIASLKAQNQEGYVNFHVKQNRTVRKWKPLYINQESNFREESFAVKIIKAYSPAFKIPERWEKENHTELINYRKINFVQIDKSDLYANNSSLKSLRGKIVLMGFMGNDREARTLLDIYYTPLKKSVDGIPVPDRYGVEIHAQILNMLLKDRSLHTSGKSEDELYIIEVKPLIIGCIAFIVSLLNMYLFLYFFVKKHMWFHLVAKIVQLLSAIIVFLLSIMLLEINIKLEPSIVLIGVLLAADALYFVEFIMKRLFNSKTYFYNPHHS